MTTVSYPAKGTGGFPIDKWTEVFEGENGIINDYAGTSVGLTRIDAGEIARISTGQVRVGGYVLEVTANHDLTVSTSAATYYIWACYDPVINVAGGGGAASAAGPCTLGISTGAPSTSGGKIYTLLYQIVRGASQALTAATVKDFRVWQGPLLHIPDSSTIPSEILTDPETAVTGFSYPVGARIVYGSGQSYTHIKSTSGLRWDASSWTTISPAPTLSSGWTLASGGGWKYRWLGKGVVWIRAVVNRSGSTLSANANGNFSPDVAILGASQLPTAIRPASDSYDRHVTAYRKGVQTFWCRANTDGSFELTHMNIPSDSLPSGIDLQIDGAYTVD